MTSTSDSPIRSRLYQEHLSLPPLRGTQIQQYTLSRVLGVWAAAALPMAALAWLVAPWLASTMNGPTAMPRALLACLTVGLVWQFVLVLALIHREQGTLRWSVVKDALWLRGPRRPSTGRRGGLVWLVVVPLILAVVAFEMMPTLPTPGDRDMGLFLESDAGQSFLSGNWVWFAVIVTMGIFNTVLGEELLFRGLLLPRMSGVFGRWDWVANGVLFGFYHLHVPWAIPRTLLDTFVLAYPSKRYHSALIGIAVHSAQTVVISALVLALVMS
jgi:membrane protease YdiL (CAAX protease family)